MADRASLRNRKMQRCRLASYDPSLTPITLLRKETAIGVLTSLLLHEKGAGLLEILKKFSTSQIRGY
jgi:hypothetical protein